VTAVIFYVAGAGALGSAIAVVVQRNPFVAALALILNLASLAALYLDLSADFVAAAQILVYAGAVMVMFLFVIAYLGDRAELELRRGGFGAAVAAVAGVAIFLEIVVAVSSSSGILSGGATVPDSFGSPATVGRLFLTNYLLAFELVSILLLVGAVAGVVLGAGHLLHSSEEGTARIREGAPPPVAPEPREATPAEPAPPEPVREEVAP
jgi:NADH:ubiquinone oxidoreductase subunit 6 (subunit J)